VVLTLEGGGKIMKLNLGNERCRCSSVQIGLKSGGGVGRKGDFGYLYAGYVMEPFKNALRYVMSSNKSPWRCCSFFTQL
jgi:hypothetical protein